MNETRGRTERRRRTTPYAAWIVGLGVWAIAGTGCSGDGPTPPPPPPPADLMCSSAQVTYCTDEAMKVATQDGGSDVSSRSTPALENAAARTALATSLGQLNTALIGGNITKARATLGEARRALETARTQLDAFAGDAADLAAIELLLDHVALVVGAS
jgi:hypothetical protein